MVVSLTGMLQNAAVSLRRDSHVAARLFEMERRLRTLHADKGKGEEAIDAFVNWYLVAGSITWAMSELPKRATRSCPQPGLIRFGLEELAQNIGAVVTRKAEGERVLDEFFALYVFEGVQGG